MSQQTETKSNFKMETNYTDVPKNETSEQKVVRHSEYLLREIEIWFTDLGRKTPNFPVAIMSPYVGLKTAIEESKEK